MLKSCFRQRGFLLFLGVYFQHQFKHEYNPPSKNRLPYSLYMQNKSFEKTRVTGICLNFFGHYRVVVTSQFKNFPNELLLLVAQ